MSAELRSGFDKCIFSDCISRLFPSARKAENAITLKLYDSIASVGADIDVLNAAGTAELTPSYLTAMEQSLPEAGFRYAVLYRHNKPLVFGYFQLFTVTSSNFSTDKTGGIFQRIIRLFMDVRKLRVVILGNALRNETCCMCFDRSRIQEDEAVSLLALVAEQIAESECALAVVLKDIPENSRAAKWLEAQKYTAPWPDKLMKLELRPEWTSIDHYLNDLSRKYKTRANKILLAREGLEIKEMDAGMVKKYETGMHALFGQVVNNQQFVLTRPSKSHFSELKQLYGDVFEVFGLFEGDDLVAYFTAFNMSDTYEVYYVGFDYQKNADRQLYFNLLFAGLERAIANGKKVLNLGRTSFDAKASLGAKAFSREYYFKAPGVPDAIVGWFTRYFSSMEDAKWQLRNPLKEAVAVTAS